MGDFILTALLVIIVLGFAIGGLLLVWFTVGVGIFKYENLVEIFEKRFPRFSQRPSFRSITILVGIFWFLILLAAISFLIGVPIW